MTTSGTGVWPGVEGRGKGGQAGVEATCLADVMDVDGTGDAVVGVVDEEAVAVEELTGGCSPQFVWVKAA
jgi:hypothetical protein